MRVLVTGGCGYIGSITSRKLMDSGFDVVVVDDLSSGHQNFLPAGAELRQLRVQETAKLHAILVEEKIEAIIHFAAFIDVAESMNDPLKYYENNLNGTVSVLDALRGTNVNKIIFSSTAAVYENPGQSLVTEESLKNPLSPYGKSKLMSEKVISESARSLGYEFVILRYFNVAGASEDLSQGQYGRKGTSLFKRAALAAVGLLPELEIFGTDYETVDGTGVRDYIHVLDLADIHVESLKHLVAGGRSNVFNCGYGRGYSVRQVIQSIEEVLGTKLRVVEKSRRPGDLGQVVASNDKLLKILPWRPRHESIQTIARSALEWEKKCLRDAK